MEKEKAKEILRHIIEQKLYKNGQLVEVGAVPQELIIKHIQVEKELSDYKKEVMELVKPMTDRHKKEIQTLEEKHEKEMDILYARLEAEAEAEAEKVAAMPENHKKYAMIMAKSDDVWKRTLAAAGENPDNYKNFKYSISKGREKLFKHLPEKENN